MKYKDYYDILGVPRSATRDAIRLAYRKLARKYHPDVSKEPDAEARFKEVGEAYKVLKDPETRAAYDQLGQNWQQGQDFKPPPDWAAGFEFSSNDQAPDQAAFSDFFESLFGSRFSAQRSSAGRAQKARDHHASVLIDLEDSYRGASRTISLQTPEYDSQGRVQNRQRKLNVKIPKGVKRGQHIRLAGQGAPGQQGGSAGDLYLEIDFRAHPLYEVHDRDVHYVLPVTPWEAALGTRINVPTPDGTVELKIPEGSGSGKKFRLKGRGIPGKPAGNLVIELKVILPPANSEKARKMYQSMAEDLAFNPREKMGG